jgi:predicted membrane-bound mannosyltransferase
MIVSSCASLFLVIFSIKMKVFGIDDNSEAFSLLVTGVIGVLLALFSFLLHRNVMSSSKVQSEVSNFE